MLVSTTVLILCIGSMRANPVRQDTGHVVINSHVYTSDGKPAQKGTFYLMAYSRAGSWSLVEKGQIGSGGEVSVNHQKRADETLDTLVVRCPGQGLFYQNAPAVSSEIRLTRGVSVPLVVALPNGAPGANLSIVPRALLSSKDRKQTPLWFPPDLASEFAIRTDLAGRCVFVDLPSGQKLSYDVPDDRFQQIGYEQQIELTAGKTSMKQLKLKLGADIRGRLTRNGNPVPGISVAAQSVGFVGGWGSSTTDAQGAFKISRLSPGAYNVALDLKPPLSGDWTSRAEEVSVQSGEHKSGIELTLVKGSLIVGHVIDNLGNPQKGIEIGIYGPAHPQTSGWVQIGQTDAVGTYQMRVPPGEQYVYVMQLSQKSRILTVADGDTATADFQIPTPGKESKTLGRITNEKGEPVPNALVDVVFDGSDPRLGLQHVTADSQGRFSVVRPPESDAVTILAHTASLGSSAPVVTKTSEEVTITIKPHQLASVKGAVSDSAGKPMSGASIQVFMSIGNRGDEVMQVKSGADGRFLVPNLFPGCEYTVWIKAPGFGEVHLDPFTPLADEVIDLKSFSLPRADSFLGGLVKDDQGSIVPGATVGIMDMSVFPVTTDSNGKFMFSGIPKGTHRMYAERGRMHTDFELTAGKGGQVVVLRSQPELGLPVVMEDTPEPAPKLKLGSVALDLDTTTWQNSKPLKMAELRGKIVVLDFWGIWCKPCVAALSGVEKLAKRFGGKVVVIGIHDSTGVPSKMAALAKAKGLTYALTIDQKTPNQTPGVTAMKYHVGGFPFLIIIDKKGKIVATPPNPERATTMIAHLLKS